MAEFRNLLEAGDVDGLRAYWARVAPQFPQPESRVHAEITMHHARTQAESLALKARAYSHKWLVERGLPTGLPDRLRPSAEQICPVTAEAVGISVNVRNEWLKPAAIEVRTAMEHAVEDAYADGRREPEFVRARMWEARVKTWRALFGRR